MEIVQIKFSNQCLIQQTQQWVSIRIAEKSGYNNERLKNRVPSYPSANQKEIVILKTRHNQQLLPIPADDLKGCNLINEGRQQ